MFLLLPSVRPCPRPPTNGPGASSPRASALSYPGERLWPTLAKTKFGQTICGQNQVWPIHLWPVPTLARFGPNQPIFGQIDENLFFNVLSQFLCLANVGITPDPHNSPPQDPPSPGLPLPRTALRWTTLRRTALRQTALRRDRSPPHPPNFRHNLHLSWWSSRGILVVFLMARALKCARLGSRAVV